MTDDADFHYLTGNQCYQRGEFSLARDHYRQALVSRPDSIAVLHNLGVALRDLEQWDEALTTFESVLRLQPVAPRALNNLGIIAEHAGDYAPAVGFFRRAIEQHHDFPDAHFNLGMVLLRLGEFREGFAECEWRWQTEQFTPLQCPHPKWDGRPLPGTLLVHTEQGAGDAFHFARFLGPAAERCNRLILIATENLHSLLQTVAGVSEIRAAGTIDMSEFHAYSPLMSLPHALSTTLESLPAKIPYLTAPPRILAPDMSGRSDGKLKVGISWAGSPTHRNDHHRSCQFTDFLPLFEVPNVSFYSLQVGHKADELVAFDGSDGVLHDLSDCQRDFGDAAAIIDQLDLLISVDTAVLHLAGALNKLAWGILTTGCDWRWMISREDSPWYPALRLFRQTQVDDWGEVFDRVKHALDEHVRTMMSTMSPS